jgi:hypothetical protein
MRGFYRVKDGEVSHKTILLLYLGLLIALDPMSPMPSTIRHAAIDLSQSLGELIKIFVYDQKRTTTIIVSSSSHHHQPQDTEEFSELDWSLLDHVDEHNMLSWLYESEKEAFLHLSELLAMLINVVQARARWRGHLADSKIMALLDRKRYRIDNETFYGALRCIPILLMLSVQHGLATWDHYMELLGPHSHYIKDDRALLRAVPLYILNGLLSLADFPYLVYEEMIINEWFLCMVDSSESIQKEFTHTLMMKNFQSTTMFQTNFPLDFSFDKRLDYLEGKKKKGIEVDDGMGC